MILVSDIGVMFYDIVYVVDTVCSTCPALCACVITDDQCDIMGVMFYDIVYIFSDIVYVADTICFMI